jgi:hypothetical protein
MENLPTKINNKMDLGVVKTKLELLLVKKCSFKILNEIFESVDLGAFSLELLNIVADSKNYVHVHKLSMTLSDDNWVEADKNGQKISFKSAKFILEQQFKNMATKFVIWKDIAKGRKATKFETLEEEAMTALFNCVSWEKSETLRATSYYREYDEGVISVEDWLKQLAFINRCMDWDDKFEINSPQDEIDFLNTYLK